jgi:sugar/nucleoside kinase (ribokinase family)
MPRVGKKTAFLGVFGHVNIDWIVNETKSPSVEDGPFFGGVAGNIAVAASRFGVPVRLGSVIGRNFPRAYLRLLQGLKIDLDFLQHNDDVDTSSCRMTNMPDGSQKKEICHGPHNEKVRMPQGFVKGIERLHVSTGLPEACISVLKLGHEAGCKVAFDPGADLKRHYDREHLLKALSYSDLLCVNEEELETTLDLLGERSYKSILKFVTTIIITKDQKGSILVEKGSETKIPAIKVLKVVDQTGAGDAYRSGLYAGLYRKYSMKDCCLLGAIASSACIQKEGAQEGLQSWTELERLFNKANK